MNDLKIKVFEVKNALADLGLNVDILETAVREGELARDSCTLNDPTCVPGIYAWGATVRSLREQLVTFGWVRNDDKNYPTVVNPGEEIAIAVATGDDATGRENRIPSTKYPKGSVTRSAVHQNQRSLFPDFVQQDKPKTITWIFLKNRVQDKVFVELSLPSVITSDGTIIAWEKRIILEPIILDEQDMRIHHEVSDEPIDISVVRRIR
jgi:hypothetical protein